MALVQTLPQIIGVVGALLVATLIYVLWSRRAAAREEEVLATLEDMAALGEVVPDTIHPVIDTNRCIGSGACVRACPEKFVLGIVGGQARLMNQLACVGHSACMSACPVDAIKLVFGSAERGVEVPVLDPHFQTTRPGVYVIGELGGMGLIRNAVRQGRQAADHIAGGTRRGGADAYDAVVVGAGPAGVSATLRLMEAGLRRAPARARQGGRHHHALPAGKGRHDRGARVRAGGLGEAPHDEQGGSRRALAFHHAEARRACEDGRDGAGIEGGTGPHVDARHERRGRPRRERPARRGPTRDAPQAGGAGRGAIEGALHAWSNRIRSRASTCSSSEGATAPSRPRSLCRTSIGAHRSPSATAATPSRAAAPTIGAASTRPSRRARFARSCRARSSSIGEQEVVLTGRGRETRIQNDAVIVQIGGTAPAELLQSFGIHVVTKRGEA